MQQVLTTADQLGYETMHVRPGITGRGWRTPVAGSAGKGFPDATLWHPAPLVVPVFFAEFKSLHGLLSDDQRRVIGTLRASGHTVHIWTPRDWNDGSIARILTGLLGLRVSARG